MAWRIYSICRFFFISSLVFSFRTINRHTLMRLDWSVWLFTNSRSLGHLLQTLINPNLILDQKGGISLSSKQQLSVLVAVAVMLGTLVCVAPLRADFHEYFGEPSIDLLNWTIQDYGGLDAVQTNGKLYINGTYDPGETAPGTNGWNQYRLIYKYNFTGFLDFSVTDSISSAAGTEYSVGIGIMENDSVCWDNITSFVQYYYAPNSAIGWVDSWFNGSDIKIMFDDTDIAFSANHTHRMVHHENGTVQFMLNGETKGWLPINLTSFYPHLVVAIKGTGTSIEAVFDDFHIVTGPPTAELRESKTNLDAGETVVLDGRYSYYRGAEIVSYYFEYGDGENSDWTSDPFVLYFYGTEGIYDARLKVRGDNGKESAWSSPVRLYVQNRTPFAFLDSTTIEVEVGDEVFFCGGGSYDPDGYVEAYRFDFGDGENTGWIFNPYVTHIFAEEGEYEVSLLVRDDVGLESQEEAQLTIVVRQKEAEVSTFDWWMILALVLILLIIAVLVILLQRKRIRELQREMEEATEQE